MKAIRIKDEDLFCRYEDAIYLEDDTYSLISGDFEKGYKVSSLNNIEDLLKNKPDGWTTLNPLQEDKNNNFHVIIGETSWGGAGFIALKQVTDNSFKWIIHLSTMNNPINIKIDMGNVYVTTDLNFPKGVDFIIPIENPRNFKIKKRN